MANNMSNYLENALINAVLRNIPYTPPAVVYLALYTTDPTDADVGTESVLGAYARQPSAYVAPTNGVTTNSADITYPVVTSGSATITHIGVRDALTVGNLLFYGPLITTRALITDNQLVFKAGQISVTLD
jgi:hypothetical protein